MIYRSEYLVNTSRNRTRPGPGGPLHKCPFPFTNHATPPKVTTLLTFTQVTSLLVIISPPKNAPLRAERPVSPGFSSSYDNTDVVDVFAGHSRTSFCSVSARIF